MALPTVEVETPSPKCSSKTWRCSSRVRSSLASRCLGSHSLSIAPFLEGLPGIGPGSTSPVSRRLFIQRFMVGIDTEKVLATSSLGVPASTAASTLNLRSFEYGFMPGGYHIWIDTYGCRCQRREQCGYYQSRDDYGQLRLLLFGSEGAEDSLGHRYPAEIHQRQHRGERTVHERAVD